LAELLEMRSGLYNDTDAPELAAQLDRDPTKVSTTDDLLAIAFTRPPNFPPGTAFEYNNTNYVLLGLIAEHVDGGRWPGRCRTDFSGSSACRVPCFPPAPSDWTRRIPAEEAKKAAQNSHSPCGSGTLTAVLADDAPTRITKSGSATWPSQSKSPSE
jgi:hypothetical protein